MRDCVQFFLNGKLQTVRGRDVFQPLSDYLRYDLSSCGTKVVCAEGDCGACSVMLGRIVDGKLQYRTVNGCIQYVFQLDSTHIVTVEGLKVNGELNSIQTAMVDCHGAQCGFCTPGFVVTMCALVGDKGCVDRPTLKEELTGNLCRCTGYEAILKAGLQAQSENLFRVDEQYPPAEMIKKFEELKNQSVYIEAEGRKVSIPAELETALKFKAENQKAVIISGGTDVCVNMNKRGFLPDAILVLSRVRELDSITARDSMVEVGARVTLRELEVFFKGSVPEFSHILWIFGSPQIRHAGTLVGNIANGSPIGDSLPFLLIMDAELELTSTSGTRTVSINSFYKGYKIFDMKADELITKVRIPVPKEHELLKLYKISRREQLDISSFAAAIRMENVNGKISSPRIAYGGVAATSRRMPETEKFLEGKDFALDTFERAGAVAQSEINPLTDVRGSKDFRLTLAQNVLMKFYFETASEKELVCQ